MQRGGHNPAVVQMPWRLLLRGSAVRRVQRLDSDYCDANAPAQRKCLVRQGLRRTLVRRRIAMRLPDRMVPGLFRCGEPWLLQKLPRRNWIAAGARVRSRISQRPAPACGLAHRGVKGLDNVLVDFGYDDVAQQAPKISLTASSVTKSPSVTYAGLKARDPQDVLVGSASSAVSGPPHGRQHERADRRSTRRRDRRQSAATAPGASRRCYHGPESMHTQCVKVDARSANGHTDS